MKRKELVKLLKSVPRDSEVLVNGQEVDMNISWDSQTGKYSVNLTEREDAAENESEKTNFGN